VIVRNFVLMYLRLSPWSGWRRMERSAPQYLSRDVRINKRMFVKMSQKQSVR
jgi:hypothetical protein